MIQVILTVGMLGESRWAPGTVASAAALLAALGWHVVVPDFGLFLLLTAAVTGLGYGALKISDPVWVRTDPSSVVIDEVAGQWVAFLPLSWWLAQGALTPVVAIILALVAFSLFRLLDIAKPPPVSWADQLGGSLGIMLDDLLAGFGAALGLLVLLLIVG